MLRTIMLGLALTLVAAGATQAAQFVIRAGEEGTRVVFTSKAPLESFDGKTDQVQGMITVDPNALSGEVQFEIKVDLASLDTGIGLRNKHMRENHLETKKYPHAVLLGGKILSASAAALQPGQSVQVRLAGQMQIHGVSRDIEVDAEIHLDAAGDLHVVSHVPLKLSDYGIKRPKFLMLKLADEQAVKVELRAHPFVAEVRE